MFLLVFLCIPAFCAACGDSGATPNDNQNNSNGAAPVCGDGTVDLGEECDDGDDNSDTVADACRTSCRHAFCGDNTQDSSELCDDGNVSDDDGCLASCAPNVCGDGFVDRSAVGAAWQVEACDDGVNDGTVCRADCSQDMTLCGNGLLDQGETCDQAGSNSDIVADGCRTNCQAAHCGDGVVDTGEDCDAGEDNGVSPERCLVTCEWTTCGDGYLGGSEQCDDATANSDSTPDACRTNCLQHRCGDGVADTSEDCDGGDLLAVTCANLGGGFDGGSLACTGGCSLDTALCWDCGNGICDPGETRTACPGECGAVSVGSGGHHSCALLSSGVVKCWGDGNRGQLGHGSNADSPIPVSVAGLNDVVRLAVNGKLSTWGHSCAIRQGGELWCWGLNANGQLGDGTTQDRNGPNPVFGVTDASDVALGRMHTCAIHFDGTASCWGWNNAGQLGDGSTTNRHQATPVLMLDELIDIAAGNSHSCAVGLNGSAWCWGANVNWQLGHGAGPSSATPMAVLGLPPVVGISVGNHHSCAWTTTGEGYCWGANLDGVLGDGTTDAQATPILIQTLSGIEEISCGCYHTCARTSAGAAWCWGWNDFGQLGSGNFIGQLLPTMISGLSGVVDIDTSMDDNWRGGGGHPCAALVDGRVFCWGDNRDGQLGDGTTTHSATPVQVVGF